MNKLAVIIPAYKYQYLRAALNSLANQTDKRFNVYIGDDNSPFELEAIVNDFRNRISIKYFRFPDNIGAKNLTDQWARCVALSNSEGWIWLFSDDDIADSICVERFYQSLEMVKSEFDVFRFNTSIIDHQGTTISVSPVGPQTESSAEMAYHLLMGQRGNSMPDHIFSRAVYESTGGFVNTRYAQAADWATSMKFSKEKGIYIIPDALLFWRYSGINISSLAGENKAEMIKGYIEFMEWIPGHFEYLLNDPHSKTAYKDIKNAALVSFKRVLKYHYRGLDHKMIIPVIGLLRSQFRLNIFETLRFIYSVKNSQQPC
jgi:glycosyltransferase involved in cell wall biosynthesis